MKKKIAFFFSLFISILSNAQSVADANKWFDRYEYGLASDNFEKIEDHTQLSTDDVRRWCYAAFVSGNYKKSLYLSDSLLKNIRKNPPYFHYVNAFSSLVLGNYKKAKKEFVKYKSLDDTYFVDSLIVTCDKISDWIEIDHIGLSNLSINDEKADFNGQMVGNYLVFFNEGGINQYKENMVNDSLESAELMLSRPSFYSPVDKVIKEPIKLSEAYNFSNISSLVKDSESNTLFITLYDLLEKNKILHSPQIYTAQLDSNQTLTNIELWKYAGLNDSSSTAQVTINESNNMLVFVKQGKQTNRADLYYSTKNDNGTWAYPNEIKTLNTQGDEISPVFLGDSMLVFSSNARVGYGGFDVYTAKVDNKHFSNISHLKSPINSFGDDYNYIPTNLPFEKSAYFTSNRVSKNGYDDDIYYILFQKIDTTSPKQIVDNWKDIIVYFDFDKYNLDKNDLDSIKKAKVLLSKWSELKILVEGHTDSRGTLDYNMNLGKERAQSVSNQLVELGFDVEDLITQSKGEEAPAVICETCSSKEHALNRFVLIKLVSKKK